MDFLLLELLSQGCGSLLFVFFGVIGESIRDFVGFWFSVPLKEITFPPVTCLHIYIGLISTLVESIGQNGWVELSFVLIRLIGFVIFIVQYVQWWSTVS